MTRHGHSNIVIISRVSFPCQLALLADGGTGKSCHGTPASHPATDSGDSRIRRAALSPGTALYARARASLCTPRSHGRSEARIAEIARRMLRALVRSRAVNRGPFTASPGSRSHYLRKVGINAGTIRREADWSRRTAVLDEDAAMASRATEQHPVNALRGLIATEANRRHLRELLGLRIDFDLPPILNALSTASTRQRLNITNEPGTACFVQRPLAPMRLSTRRINRMAVGRLRQTFRQKIPAIASTRCPRLIWSSSRWAVRPLDDHVPHSILRRL